MRTDKRSARPARGIEKRYQRDNRILALLGAFAILIVIGGVIFG